MAYTREGYWGKPRDYTHEEETVRKGQNWLKKITIDVGTWIQGPKKEPIMEERLKEVLKKNKKATTQKKSHKRITKKAKAKINKSTKKTK